MTWFLESEVVDFGGNLLEEGGEPVLLGGGEMSEDEVDVAELLADGRITSTETKAGKILGLEMLNNRFEAVVPSTGAVFAVAEFAELEVKIITNHEEILRTELVKTEKS